MSKADKAGMAVSHTSFGGIVTTMAEAKKARVKCKKSEPDCAVKARDRRSQAEGPDF